LPKRKHTTFRTRRKFEIKKSIDHLTSGCPILAKKEHLISHDEVCTHLHYSICKALGIETTDRRYTHRPTQTGHTQAHTNGTHTGPSQCMKRDMSQCCRIKQYTQTEKLQEIAQI
jgi:hypothetical protein